MLHNNFRQQSPPFRRIDRSDCELTYVVHQYKERNKLGEFTKVAPEDCAVGFYLRNHIISEIEAKYGKVDSGRADNKILEYQDYVSVESIRMFFYLLLICTRESRHLQVLNEVTPLDSDMVGCNTFVLSLEKKSSEEAVTSILKNTPKVTLGAYTSFLELVFHKGSFSSSFGGHAWYQIAKVLNDFVWGRLSGELMLDVAFTLCHNNGPIFNKGLLYNHYDHKLIIQILDSQSNGQIPNMVYTSNKNTCAGAHRAYLLDSMEFLGVSEVKALCALPDKSNQKVVKPKKQKTSGYFVIPGILKAKKLARHKSLMNCELTGGSGKLNNQQVSSFKKMFLNSLSVPNSAEVDDSMHSVKATGGVIKKLNEGMVHDLMYGTSPIKNPGGFNEDHELELLYDSCGDAFEVL